MGPVGEASIRKEVPTLHPHYQALIQASPFAILATCGPDGLDAPRRVATRPSSKYRTNTPCCCPNAAATTAPTACAAALVRDPRVGLLFLIPGVGETRCAWTGARRSASSLRCLSASRSTAKAPKCVLVIAVDTAYFQCARAIQRSKLWQPVQADAPRAVPTPGAMLQALTEAAIDGAAYDRSCRSGSVRRFGRTSF